VITDLPQAPVLTPTEINRLGTAFCTAKILMSALELGLFTELANGPMTETELQQVVGLNPRGMRDFLSVLVLLGLITTDGERYGNSSSAALYLDRGKAEYAGGFLERANHMMYPAWASLTAGLRTGAPQLVGREDQEAAFAGMMANPSHLRRFLGMMDALNGPLGAELAAKFDWSGYHTVVDAGGARGNFVAQLLRAHPHLAGTVFDLPPMAEPFAEHMAEFGRRATFTGGDFFADPMPSGDVLVLGHVLHDWAPHQRAELVDRACQAVNPGGALVVYDQMVDDQTPDIWNNVISLNMQLLTPSGSEYPVADCEAWMHAAGIDNVTAISLGEHDTAVIGRKPQR
jgi:hypothetical protein